MGRKDHLRTQWDSGHLKAKERCLTWNQPWQHFDLGLLATKLGGIGFCCLPWSVTVPYGQPQHTERVMNGVCNDRHLLRPTVGQTDPIPRNLKISLELHWKNKQFGRDSFGRETERKGPSCCFLRVMSVLGFCPGRRLVFQLLREQVQ